LLPLASLSLGAFVIEAREKYLRIAERKAENKTACSAYLELLAMYKSGELVREEIIKREN